MGQLQSLNDLDVRRFNQVDGEGVRPIDWSRDIPPVGSLGAMGDFDAMMAQKNAATKKEQERKATKLATDFLQEKKRMDEADAKMESLEKRMKEYKKEKDAAMKARRLENDKKNERRQQQVMNQEQKREERADEQETDLIRRINGADQRRTKYYSKENLAEKMAGARAKQDAAYEQALETERLMLEQQEAKKAAVDAFMERRRQQVEEEMEARRQASAEKFHMTQIRVAAHKQEWAENKLAKHKEFTKHWQDSRAEGKKLLKEKSKSVGDVHKKKYEKWRSTKSALDLQRYEGNEQLMERHENARRYCEEHAELKYKCGNDVFSYKEVKDTWTGLTRSRQDELKKSRDAQSQALLFKVAEQVAMGEAKKEAHREQERLRQRIARELLSQKSKAEEVFIKIQSEPNENKIREAMLSLGFAMPKLPDPDDEEGGGDGPKQAFS